MYFPINECTLPISDNRDLSVLTRNTVVVCLGREGVLKRKLNYLGQGKKTDYRSSIAPLINCKIKYLHVSQFFCRRSSLSSSNSDVQAGNHASPVGYSKRNYDYDQDNRPLTPEKFQQEEYGLEDDRLDKGGDLYRIWFLTVRLLFGRRSEYDDENEEYGLGPTENSRPMYHDKINYDHHSSGSSTPRNRYASLELLISIYWQAIITMAFGLNGVKWFVSIIKSRNHYDCFGKIIHLCVHHLFPLLTGVTWHWILDRFFTWLVSKVTVNSLHEQFQRYNDPVEEILQNTDQFEVPVAAPRSNQTPAYGRAPLAKMEAASQGSIDR